uniref:Kinesin-like protein n=1 Tax=Globisporangium ultimum (strain ATCC 200006 / CBS 805.95 / DAOM BR144) TaxID=431595 RepID=K3WTM0_GLOUD
MAEEANVKVFCRVRPPNEREGGSAGWMARHAGSQPVASSYVKKCVIVPASDPLQQTVFLHSKHAVPNSAPKTFTFDRAFGEDATQNDVFEVVGVPITQACLQGYNGTIFAYGQTGSGKTFTMQGPDHVIDMEANRLTDREFNLRGLVPRVFDYLFEDVVAKDSNTNVQHTFACSFLEIYNERVYDLLDGGSTKDAAGLQLRENGRKGVFVENLIESVVTNAKQAAELMTIGAQNRRVGQTAMNRESSRSHSVFILQIQSKETTPDGITKMRSSRFNLVDLAGSERQRNTEAAGDRLKEAGSINKSLSALGNVIMGLVEQSAGKNRHVHYRDSKLTFLLKDSLGGNSKTFMIATVSPAEDSSYETLSTLKFAQRAKLIRNNAVINEDSTGSVLVLQEEIQRLRRQLHQAHLESMQISQEPRLPLPPLTEISVSDTLAQCDPATDGRFRELEAAFATTIEKNSQLKRSYEHLQLREEHLKSLCSEMKRNITHLKMVLRLRSGSPVSSEDIDQESMEYEPSVDAIEWRLKCEEAEENLAQLQDEIQQRRMSENFASFDRTARIEGEIENLNFMLLSLTKQLAYVVRDKHDLQDRLQQLSKATERDYTAEGSHSDSQLEISRLDSPLQLTLNNQAREYDAKLNTLLAALAAAEDKAKDASFELLHMKQKEAAWNIHDKERNLKLQDAANMLREVEEAKRFADDVLKQEKQHHCERLLLAEREKEQVTLELEAKFANLLTSNQQLASDYETLKEESKRLAEARGHFEKVSGELAGQLESKIAEINDLQTSYNDEVTAKEKLEASFDVYKSRTVEHIGELEKTISEKSSSLDALQSELA